MESLFTPLTMDTLSVGTVILVLCSSLILGLVISGLYIFTHRKTGYVESLPITLIMLPAIISIIIILVGNSVARAFSLAGAFTLVRYRSAPGDPKDIAYVFFTMAIGLCCGMGYIAYGVLFTLLLSAVMIILEQLRYAKPRSQAMQLKITIPEDMNYEGEFDDLLDKYTASHVFRRIKSVDFGSLFELTYRIQLKNNVSQKDFIDGIRTRNGNLNVVLTLAEYEDRVYN